MLAHLINRIKEEPPTVLVVGDLMLDKFIFGSVERISPEAPVPVVKLEKEEQMLGGSGNVITNLSNLGIKTSLCSAVGKDLAGDLLLTKLTKKDTNISNVLRLKNIRTTEKMRIVADGQQIARVDWDMNELEVDFDNDLIKSIAAHIKEIDGVIISDYGKGICSNVFLKEIIRTSNESSIPIFVDPKGSDWEKYQHANLITPNIKEAEIILGEKLENDKAFEMAAEKICSAFDIEACLITRGGDGMSFFCKDNTFHLKSNAKEIFDVSGAGDTVISAMAIGLIMDLTYKQAAELSNHAAGIVVGHIGTSAITIQELLNLN